MPTDIPPLSARAADACRCIELSWNHLALSVSCLRRTSLGGHPQADILRRTSLRCRRRAKLVLSPRDDAMRAISRTEPDGLRGLSTPESHGDCHADRLTK